MCLPRSRGTGQAGIKSSSSTAPLATYPCANRPRSSTFCLMCQNLFMRPSLPVNVPLRLLLQGKLRHSFSKYCDHCTILRRKYIRSSDLPWLSLVSIDTTPVEWRLQKHGPYIQPYQSLRYAAAGTLYHSPSLVLDEKLDQFQRTSVSVRPKLYSNSTNDDSCFDQMRQWMQTCISEHKTCRQRANNTIPDFLPTRLICVAGTPRLIMSQQDDHKGRSMRYTTVSHRWGQADMPKLLQSNIDDLRSRIPPDHLTPVFRDALYVTRQLGFDYIWIDALCIVQDDIEDWRREASFMGMVYQKASCNLGALAASISMQYPHTGLSDGLFQSRNPANFTLLSVRIVRADHDKAYWAFSQHQLPEIHKTHLLERGWVYQERLLSPRSIYFDKNLTWECSELKANETFPQGASCYSQPLKPEVRLPALLPSADHFSSEIEHTMETYSTWLLLVRSYSDSHLIFRSDVFPAISGLGHYFNDILKDEYLAGIWKGDIINGLLWHRMGFRQANKGWRDRTQDHAPSWSWAAAQDGVQHNPLISKYPEKDHCLVTIHEAHINLATSDPMGAVKDGFIRMSADIRLNHDLQTLTEVGTMRFTEAYDRGYSQGIRDCEGTYFLAMTCTQFSAGFIICGLIIEPTKRMPSEFERVGAFRFDSRLRAEFRDFDMKNLDTQTITLV